MTARLMLAAALALSWSDYLRTFADLLDQRASLAWLETYCGEIAAGWGGGYGTYFYGDAGICWNGDARSKTLGWNQMHWAQQEREKMTGLTGRTWDYPVPSKQGGH